MLEAALASPVGEHAESVELHLSTRGIVRLRISIELRSTLGAHVCSRIGLGDGALGSRRQPADGADGSAASKYARAASALCAGLVAAPSALSNEIQLRRRALATVTTSVTLHSAHDLIAADLGGTSDPYARIFHDREAFSTKVQPKTLDPTWEQTFTFTRQLGELLGSPLHLEVYDHDAMSKDDLLGAATVPITDKLIREMLDDRPETSGQPHDAGAGAGLSPQAAAAVEAAAVESGASWRELTDGSIPPRRMELPLRVLKGAGGSGGSDAGEWRERGSIRVTLQLAIEHPSVTRLLAMQVSPYLWKLRAYFLYLRNPNDRSIYAKLRDPIVVIMMVVAASPDVYTRGAFFTVLLVCVLHDMEEFQLMKYILGLKGTQFLSGVFKLVQLCIGFWKCSVLSTREYTCANHGPGVKPGASVLNSMATIVLLQVPRRISPSPSFARLRTPSHAFARLRTPSHAFSRLLTPSQVLLWIAFVLLPYAAIFDRHTGTLDHSRGKALWAKNCARGELEARGVSTAHAHHHNRRAASPTRERSPVRARGRRFFRRRKRKDGGQPLVFNDDLDNDNPAEDDEWINENELEIQLLRGVGLLAADRNGLSDPYVRLALGKGHRRRSKTVMRSLNPVWDETYTFATGDARVTPEQMLEWPLQLQVFDYDRFSKNDKIGSATVDLGELLRPGLQPAPLDSSPVPQS